MTNTLQIRRGVTAKRIAHTPADGELILDLTSKQLFVGDGVSVGGVPIKASDSTKAPLASPALTGVPTAPTATVATNTTQLATTAFVQAVNAEDTGSSATALTLKTARTFTYTGDVTGNLSFNGSANVSAGMTLTNSGAVAGTYKAVTVDVKGRVTAGVALTTGLVTSTTSAGTTNLATTNTNTYLNVVETVGATPTTAGASTQVTGAGTVTVASDTAGKLVITGAQTITGNAGSATKLATPRAINGIPFDGSADITLDQNNGVFLGSVQWYNGNRNSVPDGYVTLDGQLLNRSAFPDLWATISGGAYPLVTEAVWLANDSKRASYSSGNGTTTFRLPDLNGVQSGSLKGLFARGDGNGTIAGVAVASGQTQSDTIRNITGQIGYGEGSQSAPTEFTTGAFTTTTTSNHYGSNGTDRDNNNWIFDASRVVPTSNENRPVSAIGVWIVRATGATSPLPASGSPATLLANTFNGSQKIVGNLEVTGNLDISGTLAFAKGFENSLNETGWQKLPGGLILQWGTVSLAASTGGSLTQPVIYPITFPNNVLHIFMGYRESTGGSADSLYSRDRTNTGFNAGQTAGEAHTCSWLAIGW